MFFLLSGLLFIIPILSTGPLPVRQTNLGRFFDIFVEMPLHVFFGVILMIASTPMLATFADPPTGWGIDPVGDQKIAGGLAWSYGEPVALLIVLVFARRWSRDEERGNRVADQRAEREGDEDLDAYNAYLRQLATGPPSPRRPHP